MEGVVNWYNQYFSSWLPKEVFVFFVSMVPIIELRGGLLVASMLKIPLLQANILCIKKIFAFMKDHNIMKGFVAWLERRATKKSSGAEKGEFLFLLLFVGIPIPGTGAWMGSLIASLFDFDIKKASLAILLGIFMAAIIVDIISYGLLDNFVY